MEESLASYLHAEDECRAQCEGPFDPGWYPDFVPAIASIFFYNWNFVGQLALIYFRSLHVCLEVQKKLHWEVGIVKWRGLQRSIC